MTDIVFSFQPILSKQGKVIASRLQLIGAGDTPTSSAVGALEATEEFWPIGQHAALFISLQGVALESSLFDWMLPENATLEVPSATLVAADGDALIAAIKSNNPSTCLNFELESAAAVQKGLSFRFLGLDATRFTPNQMQAIAAKLKPIAPLALALNVHDLVSYQALTDAGIAGAAGWFFLQPRPGARELAPAQAHIVRVLNLVRNNADVAQIEAALKQDVALSYRLLRYINSAGFGLSVEVQSFRHAVTILGYDKLNKWLSLLLVSSSKDPLAPAMLYAALTRARLMELLAQGTIGKDELDNLFITGAFSLLDRMLGVDLDKALEPMHLPESIQDALLQKTGPYAAYLDLAEAAERGDRAELMGKIDALGITPAQHNASLMQALAFAANLSF